MIRRKQDFAMLAIVFGLLVALILGNSPSLECQRLSGAIVEAIKIFQGMGGPGTLNKSSLPRSIHPDNSVEILGNCSSSLASRQRPGNTRDISMSARASVPAGKFRTMSAVAIAVNKASTNCFRSSHSLVFESQHLQRLIKPTSVAPVSAFA